MKCKNCEGQGEYKAFNKYAHEEGEPEYIAETCSYCEGTGEIEGEEDEE